MGKYIREKKKSDYKPVAIALGIYAITLPLDYIGVGNIGSFSKLIAFVPMLFFLFQLRQTTKLKMNGLFLWLILYLSLASVSYTYSISQQRTLNALGSPVLNILMILTMGGLTEFCEKEIAFLKKCLIIGSWVAVVFVIFFGITPYGRATISFGEYEQDQNYLCGYMFFAFIFHFERFINQKKVGHLLLALIILIAVVMTGSRGALLALFICIIFEVFAVAKENHHGIRTLIISIVGLTGLYLLITILVIPNLDSTIAERFSLEYIKEEGTTGRAEIWAHLWSIFKGSGLFRQIFGNGYGTTMYLNDLNHKVAHNLYIDTLITLGIIGVVFLLGIQISCLRIAYRKKDMFLFCAMIGYAVMCMSMSLVSYKPLWVTIMMTMILDNNEAVCVKDEIKST